MTTLSWREKHLLELLQNRPLSTAAIVLEADMTKATALKWLECIKAQDLVTSIMIGPTKIWWATNFCDECHNKMVRHEIYICPDCGSHKLPKNLEDCELNGSFCNKDKGDEMKR